MDSKIFDNATKVLGSAITRRTGILAAVVGLVTASGTALEGDAARKATRRHEKLACRNANSECLSNEECCSGVCKPKFGGTGFRCAKGRGGKKSKDNGKGKNNPVLQPIPTGEPCTDRDTCLDPAASCTTYDDDTPAGTYCILPASAMCIATNECVSHHCLQCECCSHAGTRAELGTWGTEGSANNQLNYPLAIALTPDGLQMLIVDAQNDRIALWARPAACSTGGWEAQTPFGNSGPGTLTNPKCVAISADGLTALVTDHSLNAMLTYRRTPGGTDWAYVTSFPSDSPGPYDAMRGVALSPDNLTMILTYEGTMANFSVYTRASTNVDTWTFQARYSQPGPDPDDLTIAQWPRFSSDGLVLYFGDDNRVKFWTRPATNSTVFTFSYAYGTPGFDASLGELFEPSGTWLSDDQLTLIVVISGQSVAATYTRPDTSTQSWNFLSQVNLSYPTDVAVFDDDIYFTNGSGDNIKGFGLTCGS